MKIEVGFEINWIGSLWDKRRESQVHTAESPDILHPLSSQLDDTSLTELVNWREVRRCEFNSIL